MPKRINTHHHRMPQRHTLLRKNPFPDTIEECARLIEMFTPTQEAYCPPCTNTSYGNCIPKDKHCPDYQHPLYASCLNTKEKSHNARLHLML